MRIFSSLFFAAGMLALLSVVGCRPEDNRPAGVYVSDKSRTYEQLKDSDVMVSVNGVGMTKRDFKSLYDLRIQLFSLQRSGRLLPKVDDENMPEMAAVLVMELIHRELFRQYAKDKAIVPSDDQIDACRKRFLVSIKHRENDDLGMVAASLETSVRKRFLAIPFEDARDKLLRQSVTTNDLNTVTDAEIAARERFVKKFDDDANAFNEGQRKKLAKARRQILDGREFKAVAKEISEVSPEHGEKWTTVELGELPNDEDLYKWLSKAKVGEISEPIDLSDGIGIVKLVSMGKGPAPAGTPLPDTYTLVKCTLFAHETMRYQDRNQMRQQLRVWKQEEAQKKLGMMLYEAAVIDYPNGTSFFPEFDKIYNESKEKK